MVGLKKFFLLLAAFFSLLIVLALALTLVVSPGGFSFSKTIAVVPIKGEITSEKGLFAFQSSDEVIEMLEEADKDASIGVILLVIDSSGGTIVATKEIVRKVRSIEKPVVSFISEVGASGGYYIAAATDLVVADHDSITGSIGVISVSPNFEGLMEKIGVKMRILKEGEFKDIGSPYKEMSPKEEELLQAVLHGAFKRFKEDILEFREGKITSRQLEEVADGRILSGEQAKEVGLVDVLGGKALAIKEAAMLAGITGEPVLEDFSAKGGTDFFSMISESGYAFGSGLKASLQGLDSKAIRT